MRESIWTVRCPSGMCAQPNTWLRCCPQVRSRPFSGKSLVRLFGIHALPQIRCQSQYLRILCVLQSLRLFLAPCRSPTETGPWDEQPESFSNGVATQRSACGRPLLYTGQGASSSRVEKIKCLHGETHCVLRNKKAPQQLLARSVPRNTQEKRISQRKPKLKPCGRD